jgi:hypothetical protein
MVMCHEILPASIFFPGNMMTTSRPTDYEITTITHLLTSFPHLHMEPPKVRETARQQPEMHRGKTSPSNTIGVVWGPK